jgi:hypothetical protein
MPTKSVRLSDTKKRTIGKTDDVKSSAARQAWKRDVDSVEEAGSFVAAAFRRAFRELGTKMAIGFLSGWTFH